MRVRYGDGVNALVNERGGIRQHAEMRQRGILVEFSREIQWNNPELATSASIFRSPNFAGPNFPIKFKSHPQKEVKNSLNITLREKCSLEDRLTKALNFMNAL
jgi:hypothetical protein